MIGITRVQISSDRSLSLLQGDITEIDPDAPEKTAIVNAANTSLLGGGGVDGAIHRAAGPGLLAETRELGGTEVGVAKASGAHGLSDRAGVIVHTVGPDYRITEQRERAEELLIAAYTSALEVAAERGATDVVLPSLSTGVYDFPLEWAARIAIETVLLNARRLGLEGIAFVLFDEQTSAAFSRALLRAVRLVPAIVDNAVEISEQKELQLVAFPVEDGEIVTDEGVDVSSVSATSLQEALRTAAYNAEARDFTIDVSETDASRAVAAEVGAVAAYEVSFVHQGERGTSIYAITGV